jgi:DNA-binding protein H-NS
MPTYTEMIAQIEELKKQAEKTRREEFSAVLKTIKKQISDYGFSADDLGFGKTKNIKTKVGIKNRKSKLGRVKRSTAGSKVSPKYHDGSGNTWTGRGKQPRWVAEALASGKTLDSLLIHRN